MMDIRTFKRCCYKFDIPSDLLLLIGNLKLNVNVNVCQIYIKIHIIYKIKIFIFPKNLGLIRFMCKYNN